MQEFLYLENCAENNIETDIDNIDATTLFELGIEYLNLDMFSKSLESYEISSNDIKYIKKRLLIELNENKPRYKLVCSFLNEFINDENNFDKSDEFILLLTNVLNLRDSIFGKLVLKLSKPTFKEYSSQIIDVALYSGYTKSARFLFKKLQINKDEQELIKRYKRYKEIGPVLASKRILEKRNKEDKFSIIVKYSEKASNTKTKEAYYIGRSLLI